jgi:hypothetical protein
MQPSESEQRCAARVPLAKRPILRIPFGVGDVDGINS